MVQGIRNEGIRVLPWTKSALQWQERVLFLREQGFLEFPNLCEQWLLEHLEQWLVPFLEGTRSIVDLAKLSLRDMLVSLCSWEQQQQIERWAPTHVIVPSGSRIPIDYSNPLAPCIQVRLQEVFGWENTPKIAEERVPITIVLLSPANRPVQVTKDLANFWKQTYFEIKKDLKGRYPKHYWPDDPTIAIATRGTRPKIT
jgi:ATP-dependent helicase HrpB